MAGPIEEFEIDRIFLYEENPRHEPLTSQDEIIEQLCRGEQVLQLAESICKEGTNPLELVGVVEKNGLGKRRSARKIYEVWEGNRRVCAIKLLNDPDLAPSRLRERFKRLAQGYKPIKKIPGRAFPDHKELRFWMENIHGGEQGGVGRKRWDTEQKERHTGSTRNAVALALFDVAQQLKYITKDQRKRRLTTFSRYVNSRAMKEALGIDDADKSNIKFDRTSDDFKAMLKVLIKDLLDGEITSRDNLDPKIISYARGLADRADVTAKRTTSRPIGEVLGAGKGTQKTTSTQRQKPKKPDAPTKIVPDETLQGALDAFGNNKLERFYYSICDVSAEHHTQLVAVGAWAFIETLTACVGRNEGTSFVAFFSDSRLGEYGVAKGQNRNVVKDALQRLAHGGNTTKHHPLGAAYNGAQLINDMAVVTPLLIQTLSKKAVGA